MSQEIPYIMAMPCLDASDASTLPGDWLASFGDVTATCSANDPGRYVSAATRMFDCWSEVTIPRGVDFLVTALRQMYVPEPSTTTPRFLPTEVMDMRESLSASSPVAVSSISGVLRVAEALFAEARDATDGELAAFDRVLLRGASIFKD